MSEGETEEAVHQGAAGWQSFSPRRAGRLSIAASVVVLLCFGLIGFPAAAAAETEPCPNAARRAEQGPATLALPECRAYELVSPGGLLTEDSSPARASVGGDAITYYTNYPAAEATTSGFFYLANRLAGGWSVQSVGPQYAPAVFFEDKCEENVYFSPDLAKNVAEVGWYEGEEAAHCKRNEVPLVPGEPTPYRNVFLHQADPDAYELVNVTPAGAIPANAKYQDASDDFSHIVFGEEAKLTPDAPAGYNFYLWNGGSVRLITILPDGSAAEGELVEATGHRTNAGPTVSGNGFAPVTGAVSADGERIFFYSGEGLFLRLNADQAQSPIAAGKCTESDLACTVEVDASHGAGPSGGGVFWRASSDGSRVFFTDDRRLTGDSTAAVGQPDLYEYDADTATLTDLTASAGEPADVRGVPGIAEDGSRVYFVANGVLAPGATSGSCTGTEAAAQVCNLYLLEKGSIRFVATLSRDDRFVWQESNSSEPRRKQRTLWADVSPSGRFLAFNSARSLTGYDNRDAREPASFDREIFLYDAATSGAGGLSCVSCIPDGTRPSSSSFIEYGGNYGPSSPGGNANWPTTAVLDDGHIFFTTRESLGSGDTNNASDAYGYEDGQPYLISTGAHSGGARFLDTTPSGSDVFFETAESLVGADVDNENFSIYDARVEGGFPDPPAAQPECGAEDCRGPGSVALPSPVPGSSTLRRSRKGCARKRGSLHRCGKGRPGKRRHRRGGHRPAGSKRGKAGR